MITKAYIRDTSGVIEFVAALNSSTIAAVSGYVSGFYFTDYL